MDRIAARRGLILLSSPLILWMFLRKSWVQLALLALLYANAERWLAVKPYRVTDLVDFFSDHLEATIGFVGLIVAFAAGKGFVESKQLDLKLALESEIGEFLREGSRLIRTCRLAAESMVEVETLARMVVIHAQASNISPVVFPTSVEGAFDRLLRRSRDLRETQSNMDPFLTRFREMEQRWAPLIRSSLIISIALEKAKHAFSAISASATLLEPQQDWTIEEFLVLQQGHWGTRAEEFVGVARGKEGRFHAWMGGATGMGSSSIFRPSVLLTAKLWWNLFRMRE